MFEDAFNSDEINSNFFIVSPPTDKIKKKITRYLVFQKALASIGVEFNYHLPALSSEAFALAMLGSIKDSYYDDTPLQACIAQNLKS